jgi:hypothetical protein
VASDMPDTCAGYLALHLSAPVVRLKAAVLEPILLAAAQVCVGARDHLRGQLECVAYLLCLVRRKRELIVVSTARRWRVRFENSEGRSVQTWVVCTRVCVRV